MGELQRYNLIPKGVDYAVTAPKAKPQQVNVKKRGLHAMLGEVLTALGNIDDNLSTKKKVRAAEKALGIEKSGNINERVERLYAEAGCEESSSESDYDSEDSSSLQENYGAFKIQCTQEQTFPESKTCSGSGVGRTIVPRKAGRSCPSQQQAM